MCFGVHGLGYQTCDALVVVIDAVKLVGRRVGPCEQVCHTDELVPDGLLCPVHGRVAGIAVRHRLRSEGLQLLSSPSLALFVVSSTAKLKLTTSNSTLLLKQTHNIGL